MTPRTYVDVHILQTVPPSNLNRDEAGTPKQAVYGGVRRARVSSQAWKRATRVAFEERLALPAEQLGTRTKRVSVLLASRLADRTQLDPTAAERLSTYLLKDLKVTPGKKAIETAYLLFFGQAQLDSIVDLVTGQAVELAALDDEALDKAVANLPVREQLTKGHPIDVALFGRMVADLPALNVDAAVQVAHALSTHAAQPEFDYYTAVDDQKDPKVDDAGAAMLGTVEFTSATFYRYATVGLHQLVENLDGNTEAAVAALTAFLRAFVYSMPTGHENSFAHHTLPNLVSVVVRADQPVNLVSAFEVPITASNGTGIATASAKQLAAELQHAHTAWGMTPLLAVSQYNLGGGESQRQQLREQRQQLQEAFGPPVPFAELVDTVGQAARQRLVEMVAR